jgi:hypothetical protein
MRLRAATVALTAAAALLAAQPAAAADRCKVPRGSSTVAKTSRVHVYFGPQRVDGPEAAAYACNRRSGRRFKLDDPRRELALDSGGDIAEPRIAGYQLAYVTVQHEGAESIYYRLRALDLATGKRRALGSYFGELEGPVEFSILASGVVAWHELVEEAGALQSRVWLWGAAGRRMLDSAPETLGEGPPAIRDLGVTGSAREPVLYWMNGETPRSAAMR